jgi:cephalosporin hydroxylase
MANLIRIDLDTGDIERERDGEVVRSNLDQPDGFAAVSEIWLRSGWQTKHVYTFSWLGRPVIQLPEDMIRLQEVIVTLQPDVIIETGIAHGGSLVFYASLCRLLGRGRVVGVDIEIRPHNREALDAHPLRDLITVYEGSSTDPEIIRAVRREISPDDKVLVLLDSNHSKAHVMGELEAYAPLVTRGSYILAADGLMQELAGLRRFEDERETEHWAEDNPQAAVREFLKSHPEFVLEPPPFSFNESPLTDAVTYFPGGWLKRIS